MEVTTIMKEDLQALIAQVKNADHLVSDYGRNVDRVQELHKQILANPLADTSAEHDLSDLIGTLRLQNGLVRDELLFIKKSLMDPKGSTMDELARIPQQYESLKAAFLQHSNRFKSNQTHFRDECKSGLQRHLKSSETEFTDEEVTQMIDAGSFTMCITNEAELHERHQAYVAEAEARHKCLTKVEASLDELRDIMAKFDAVFDGQGEAVDEAEYRVLVESKNLEDANEKLKHAQRVG